MNIEVKIIPHKEQRYETIGDWVFNVPKTKLFIYVSDLGDWRYNMLVAVHEQVEALLCLQRDIDEKTITAFDKKFECERLKHKHTLEAEPGDDPRAPYRAEHFFATNVERLLAAELGVDWGKYEEAVYAL